MVRSGADPENEAGFGLVEVVVSMFLLALIAVAFLPVLIQGMRTAAHNATFATAGQLASQQLERVRNLPATCDDVSAFDDAALATVTDTRGNVYQPHVLVGVCPTVYPGVVEVRSWVTQGASTELAEALTLVYLVSESATTPTPTPTASP